MLKHIELNNEVMKKIDDFFQLEKDYEAIHAFQEEVDEKLLTFPTLEERFSYLVNEAYYYDLFLEDGYTMGDVKEVYNVVQSVPFEFQSYMAISKFYRDYALKSNDKTQYLETYQDRIAIVALFLAQGNVEDAKRFAHHLAAQHYQPATPTFLNGGRKRRGELVSCFLLEIDDTLNAIGTGVHTSMQLSKIGGGVALNLSKLRGRGETIKEIKGAASGVMPVVKLLEDSFSYANQLGQRKGAGAAYLNIFHWDIEEFLDCKKINADEKTRIQALSIGVIVPKKFFELAKENRDVYVFAPRTVYETFGAHLDEMYETLLHHPKVEKRHWMSARDVLTKIATLQLESGYPYFMFSSNANEQHPLKNVGKVKMSNLCTEIFQLQETSVIHDYGIEDEIKRDVSCNLGSINIVNVMENNALKEAVFAGMDMLTAVTDMSSIQNAPSINKANRELHSVGLGVMNMHGFLAKNKVMYESEEAKDFANTFFMAMNFYSIQRSMEIAKKKGDTFADFEQSDYATGVYFEKYLHTSYAPKTEKVKELFSGHDVPTEEDWHVLKQQVQRHGMYHAYRMAIAPTQSISYLQNSTSSVMPITSMIETRTYGNATTFYPMPYLSRETYWFYSKTAYDMDMMKLIDFIGTIQTHVDQGISCTLFVNSSVTTRELARYYIYAQHKGLKSLYYTRTRTQSIEECVSCAL